MTVTLALNRSAYKPLDPINLEVLENEIIENFQKFSKIDTGVVKFRDVRSDI